ncbi:hypothetical protein, partial [Streptomyces scabiei]|uniref:hypothetical protein n=1 Tax=Streptomyces scabiei TaxID=1930 RepID=UPI0029B36BB0
PPLRRPPPPRGGRRQRHIEPGSRDQVSLEELANDIAGGTERAALKHELARVRGVDVNELAEGKDLTRSGTE